MMAEAIVTVLSEKGAPTPVAWTRVRAPRSVMGPADPAAVAAAVAASPLHATYATPVDRESAYEMLIARLAPAPPPPNQTPVDDLPPVSAPYQPPPTVPMPQQRPQPRPRGRSTAPQPSGGGLGDMMGSPVVSSFFRSFGSAVGGALGRSMFGTRRRR